MKRNPEKTVAALVAIALVSLISVQVYWAKRTYDEAEAVFNERINKILTSVRDEANNAATCFTLYSKTYINPNEGIYLMKSSWHGKMDQESWDGIPDSIPMFFNVPEEYKDSPLNRVYKDLKFSTPVTTEILLKFRYDMNNTSPEKEILNQKISTSNFKELFKNHEALLSIYDTIMIDSLIRYHLKNNNIKVEYSYALVKNPNDSIEYCSNPSISRKILTSGIRTRLTPEDMFSYPCDIIFYTGSKPQYILKNIFWVLSLSIGIIFLLLFGYLYFIRNILKHKKLSEMKNDFINNMTHEFNTPISNISLAYETLIEKGKIVKDPYSERIIEIIKGETERLKDNVTRILRISSFDRTGLNLINEEVDLSKLIDLALNRLELKIKQKNACIKLNIPDYKLMISGDTVHLSGAIENLIDNALKYSSENCKISISVLKNGSYYSLHIEDNGVGIKKEELEKIFDKFYRIQHGNIQNDRGFGIGLNYVKYVIDAHNGKISVSSIPGEGSCFKILLPFYEGKNNHTSNGRR